MEKKTIRIRAAADAPDEVAIGNLIARKEHGYYETDHEAFGDYIRSNFGIHPAADEDDEADDSDNVASQADAQSDEATPRKVIIVGSAEREATRPEDEAAAAFAEPSADSTAAEIPEDMEQNDKPEKKGGKK